MGKREVVATLPRPRDRVTASDPVEVLPDCRQQRLVLPAAPPPQMGIELGDLQLNDVQVRRVRR